MTKFMLQAGRFVAIFASAMLLTTAVIAAPPAHKKKTPTKKTKKVDPKLAMVAAGKKVFTKIKCSGCHPMAGVGSGQAPDLASTGVDKEHTAKWFAEFVTDPKSKHPDSGMPSFAETVKGKDLKNLAVYLTTLKAKK